MYLVYVILASVVVVADGIKDEMTRCCTKGHQWAGDKRNACDNFPVPIEGISTQLQTLCISWMELCCTETRRQQQCQMGIKAGQSGRHCIRLSGVGGEHFRDCCMGCKLGLQVSSKTDNCHNFAGVLFAPWQSPFIKCCEEIHNGTFTEPDDDTDHSAALGSAQQDQDDSDSFDASTIDGATRISLKKPNKCPDGFRYNSRLNVCDDIDECLDGLDNCLADSEICQNTIGGFICEEMQPSAPEEQCPPGYRFFLTSCIDIDECDEGTDDCEDEDTVCVNTDGGFACQTPETFNLIPACPVGYEANKESGTCEDINECTNDMHSCLESQRCDNTIGSYTCVRYMTCGTGYTLNHDTGKCEDDDECASGTHNCGNLGPGYLCLNTQGSFRCEKRRCKLGEIFNPEDGSCSVLRCQAGFEAGPSGSCVDVDECQRVGGDDAACGQGRRCVNTMGSYECISRCELGLKLDPETNSCKDVDECSSGLAVCLGGTQCINTIGSYRCSCPDGFKMNSRSGRCEDINECAITRGNVCGIDSECQNSLGSYRCLCKPGFVYRNGVCLDINECQEIANICQQRCTNLWGSYRCHCRPGFRLSPDGRSCQDIDECSDYEDLCIGNCVNEPGSYKCACPSGYVLSSNGRSCQDIDECRNENPCRGPNQLCFNTRGGFKCNNVVCPPDYALEEGHDRRCRRKSTRCQSGDMECLRKPVSISHNFIALISNLRVQGQGVNLFTMQSARYRLLTTKFTLTVQSVRTYRPDVVKADTSNFRLKTAAHSAILSLVKPIQGPQDVTLELLMEMYHMGRFQASAAANIYIFVTPHEF